jgi:hypothetical protein
VTNLGILNAAAPADWYTSFLLKAMARYYSTWAERQRSNARVKLLVLSELYSDIVDEDRLKTHLRAPSHFTVNVTPNSSDKNKQDKRPFKRGHDCTKSNKLTHNTQDCFFNDPNKKVEFLRRQLKPEAANHLENPSSNDNYSDSDNDEEPEEVPVNLIVWPVSRTRSAVARPLNHLVAMVRLVFRPYTQV